MGTIIRSFDLTGLSSFTVPQDVQKEDDYSTWRFTGSPGVSCVVSANAVGGQARVVENQCDKPIFLNDGSPAGVSIAVRSIVLCTLDGGQIRLASSPTLLNDSNFDPTPPAGLNGVISLINIFAAIVAWFLRVRLVVGTGVAATDVANVQAACTAMTGSGTVYLYGTFVFNAPIVLSLCSSLTIVMHQSTTIQSTMANTGVGGFTNSIFFATQTGAGASNLLTADATFGTRTIAVTSAVTVGATIVIGCSTSGNLQQTATVLKTSGGGLTLTLDEEVMYGYFTVANNAFVRTITSPKRITIVGNGARAFGTGDRVVEFAFSRYCYVSGIVVDQTLGAGVNGFLNVLFSFDIGCRDCGGWNLTADGGSDFLSGTLALVGFARESSLRCWWRDCLAENFASGYEGFATFDCVGGYQQNTISRNCNTGFYWGANDSAGTEGSNDAGFGVQSENCTIGATFDQGSKTRINGWTSLGDATSFNCIGTSAASLQATNVYFRARGTGAYNSFTAIEGEVEMTNVVFDLTAVSGTKTICDWSSGVGTFKVSNAKTIGGAYGLYLEDGVAQKIRIGANVDFSSPSVTPWIRNGTTSSVVGDFAGAGAPAIQCNVGSTYRRTNGGAGTSLYVKESAIDGTGWVGK